MAGMTYLLGGLLALLVAFASIDKPVAKPTQLDPALRQALVRAEASSGIELFIRSGVRAPAEQRRLFREAMERYGSKAEARRWVATPRTSPHVSGDAVDLGPTEALPWLAANGAEYGLCQIYANEP